MNLNNILKKKNIGTKLICLEINQQDSDKQKNLLWNTVAMIEGGFKTLKV